MRIFIFILLSAKILFAYAEEARLPGEVFRDCPECPEMVVIIAGSFDMGSNKGELNEQPVHRVTISKSFAIGKVEITQGQWRAIMSGQRRTIIGNDPSYFSSCGDDCPVEQISWNDAKIFIQRLIAKTRKHYRLPTEAEWEYSCRGGQNHQFCGSDQADVVAWHGASDERENADKTVKPIARKQANAFGLYDMSGNVWEWVEDSYHSNYKGAPMNGDAWQKDGKLRVLRGGSWFNGEQLTRASTRSKEVPVFRSKFVGLRVVRILP